MENGLHIIFIWIHVLGIALFLGGQAFLAFAWVPASRAISDLPTRIEAMRTVTQRFLYVGGGGLVLIVIAGAYLISTWRDYWGVGGEVEFTELRYGVIFIIKMSLLIIVLGLAALHSFILGPRLIERMEDQAAGKTVPEDEVRGLRMQSMMASIATFVLTIALVGLGATLSTGAYSLQEF